MTTSCQHSKDIADNSKPETESSLRHLEDKQRFVLVTDDGHEAFLDYAPVGDNAFELYHTEVPVDLRGRGVGSKLAGAVFEHLSAASSPRVASS